MLSNELISKIMLFNSTNVASMIKPIILMNKTGQSFYEWFFESINHTVYTHTDLLLFNPNCGICTYQVCDTCLQYNCICNLDYDYTYQFCDECGAFLCICNGYYYDSDCSSCYENSY